MNPSESPTRGRSGHTPRAGRSDRRPSEETDAFSESVTTDLPRGRIPGKTRHAEDLAPRRERGVGRTDPASGTDRAGYAAAREPRYWSLLVRDDSWSQQVGWSPPSSDVGSGDPGP